jgi:hypothetical protein
LGSSGAKDEPRVPPPMMNGTFFPSMSTTPATGEGGSPPVASFVLFGVLQNSGNR